MVNNQNTENVDEETSNEEENDQMRDEDELLSSVASEQDEEDQEIDLDLLEPDEAIGELFEKINPLTIPSIVVGTILLIITFTSLLDTHPIAAIIVGFAGGLSFVFGCSELIIFGVKGLAQKFGWSPYFMGIIAAIGADSSDIIVVTILLTRAKNLPAGQEALANNLTLTSITLILTTVLINCLILGITIIIVARKKPFKLPKELSSTESNLILAMAIFSFIFIVYGFTMNSLDAVQIDRAFEGAMGASLLLFYIIFIAFLIGDARQKKLERIGPQVLISEYFSEEENKEINHSDKERGFFRRRFNELFKKDHDEEGEQFIALRRFPWYVLVISFVVGITGIVFGGKMISDSIESGVSAFQNLPILVYSVIVGFVSSAPEMSITFRSVLDPEKEDVEIGLIHQISSINQTYFLLFGFPFLFAAIVNIDIPVALDTTLVFTGIFAISLALHLTIIDDNQFDRVEGTLILIASLVSLMSLAVVGGLLN
ncbi:MAG: hypothetical protein FK733_01335 [Asgard group archaeon]|nr:hypothetical protein [Asgard group archaeon]